MCNQNIFTVEIGDMHSLWQGVSDYLGQHFESSINCMGGRYLLMCFYLTITVL